MIEVVSYLTQFLSALPSLIKAGTDVIGQIESTHAAVKQMVAENRAPSAAEWAALNTQITNLSTELNS